MPRTLTDYAPMRTWMVETQLRSRDIRDQRVLDAFAEVPRHEFVPSEQIRHAYEDCPLPIGEGQTISQPYIVAAMTEALGLTGVEKVLEVGTGSGYQAAILGRLAGYVCTVERYASLSARAQAALERLGYDNVTCIVGDGSEGYATESPYDGILVTAAAPDIPQALTEQLADGGRLVIPVGEIYTQDLILVKKQGTRTVQKTINYCRFVPLTGKYGWGGAS